MFINDKKTLGKALYVCLTVSSMVVTSDAYGMDQQDDYTNAPSRKRTAISVPEDRQPKRQKNNQGQSILIGPEILSPRKPFLPDWEKKPEGIIQKLKPSLFERFYNLSLENQQKGLDNFKNIGLLNLMTPSSHEKGHS